MYIYICVITVREQEEADRQKDKQIDRQIDRRTNLKS